ncbi:hypothetical protein FSP39_002534 [Pinctada imbricata]|uniref:BTB domain-containing protein n=1 Tax=Pinctada imbricata TaxID=66713 RepID=A0AA88YKE5_PINIB|nr:hypothetical protein FSP39_002534 [Pinctada imbricata]
MNYQKTYMNHIHSSSLLCQLATMWKSQTLCDAIIRSGNNITRAHRVVLVAACPMLQSMENAASGSHLEVRVASDIKVESIHTFLQYLYEGFMTLTEENCKDVEKIARLLQVDGVVKCCADFHKCLNTSSAGQYKYSLLDQIEFRHVRTTDLSKCQDKMQKRQLDTGRMSPGGKRQKVHRPSSPPTDHSMSQRMSDMHSMSESYMPDANDPWDRVPRLGASGARSGSQPGIIDIVEDSLELIQTDPPGKHPGENSFDTRRVQQTVGISVASQHNKGADLQIVNVAEQQAMSSAARPPSDIIPSSPSSSSSSSFKDAMGSSRPPDPRGAAGPPPPPQLQRMDPGRQPSHGTINLVDIPHSPDPEISKQASRQQGRSSEAFPPSSMASAPPRSGDNFQSSSTPQRPSQPFPVSLTAVPRGGPSFQSKPYAAGSAVQAEASSPRGPRSQSRGDADRASPAERAKDTGPKSTPDMSEGAPDISIVKVERTSSNLAGDTVGGLDMFVSEGGVSLTPVPGVGQGEDDEHSDFELEEPPGEMSKEIDLSNMSN